MPAMQFHPWVGKIPWRREMLPTPVFWPGEYIQSMGLQRVGHDWASFTSLHLAPLKSVLEIQAVSTLGLCYLSTRSHCHGDGKNKERGHVTPQSSFRSDWWLLITFRWPELVTLCHLTSKGLGNLIFLCTQKEEKETGFSSEQKWIFQKDIGDFTLNK